MTNDTSLKSIDGITIDDTIENIFESGQGTLLHITDKQAYDELVRGILVVENPPVEYIMPLKLCLDEMLTNDLLHGNKSDYSKGIDVHYLGNGALLTVTIRDKGEGFNPREVPNPVLPANIEKGSGRGVLLVHNYTKWLCYNSKGNCVQFTIKVTD